MAVLGWKDIAEDVRGQIASGELVEGARVSSEEEIAERYGVSRHTAHRALNELQRQGLLVRQRRWGTVVASQSRPRTGRIGFVVDYSSGVFQADLMRSIQAGLRPGGSLVIADSMNDPAREAAQIAQMRNEVDGIVCYPTGAEESEPIFRSLIDAGYPLVFVDRAPHGFESQTVLTDHEAGAYRAVSELVNRGHRRIAYFGGENVHVQSVAERRDGYLRAIDHDPRPYSRFILLELERRPALMVQWISDALVAMRTLPEPPTAAFCVQDCLAVSLLEACSMHGLSVPDDLEVATYNDFSPVMLRFPSRLHRVVQRAGEIGRIAVERLYSQMDGESIEPGPIRVSTDFYPAVEFDSRYSTLTPAGAASPAVDYQWR